MGSLDQLFKGPTGHPARIPDCITPDNMSNKLTAELVVDIDTGDWELSSWETEFIESCLGKSQQQYSINQKQVIYKLAKRFNLL